MLHKQPRNRPALKQVLQLDIISKAAPRPVAAAPSSSDRPLPPSWRKVPSASRPGEFSYLHVPTGFKQAEVPTADAPPPAAFAAWSKANNATNGRPPPTAVGGAGGTPGGGARPRMGAPGGKLEPVIEHRSNQAQHAFGAVPANKGRPPSAARALGPHGHANQQQMGGGQRPRGLV